MKFNKQILNEFMKYSYYNCNTDTVNQFQSDLLQFQKRSSAETVEAISVMMIIEYTDYLRDLPKGKCSRTTNTGDTLAPRTVARKITALKNFFKFLNKVYDAGIPAEKIDIPKYSKPKMEYLTREEFEEFFQIVLTKPEDKEHKLRSLLLIKLAYYTGMRLSELLSVKVDDILKDTKMQILGKGKVWRTVYYPPEIQEMVREYLKYRTTDIPYSKRNK